MQLDEVLSIGALHHKWFLVTGAVILLISLVEAWIVSLIYYLKISRLKRLFPSPHQLIRSHVDYCIMAGLLGLFYVSTLALDIALPAFIVFLTCLGAVYNPAPLILMAMRPAEKARQRIGVKIGVFLCVGFLPVTIGYGYIAIAVIHRAVFGSE